MLSDACSNGSIGREVISVGVSNNVDAETPTRLQTGSSGAEAKHLVETCSINDLKRETR